MNYCKIILVICLLCCSFSIVYADASLSKIKQVLLLNPPGAGKISHQKQQEKYLKLNQDGIKVYIYSNNNSALGTFKAVTHINTSLDSLLAVMLDNNACIEWIHACGKSFVIKKISFNERYHYQVCNLPFPFKNRDFIIHSNMKQDPLSKAVTITMSSAAEYCNDKWSEQCKQVNQSGLVRVRKSIGRYKLEPNDNGTTITWIQHTDPGGNLPSWLVNQFVKNTPYLSLKNLAQKVKEDKYQYSKLIFNKEGVAVALNTADKKQESRIASDFSVHLKRM